MSAVWACIQAITNPIASSPWLVYEVDSRKRTYLPDDKLGFILNQRANPEITAIAFREAMMFGCLATGNAYAEISRDSSNRVTALYPLVPESMQVLRDAGGRRLIYRYTNPTGGTVDLTPEQVFHLRGPVTVVGLLGDSIVGRASKAIALAAAAERFSLSYLSNGAVPSLALKYPQKLDAKSLDRIREQVADRYSGPGKAGKPLVLEGGMDVVELSADPDKAQLGATQNWTVEQIARLFGVPGVKIGVAASSQGYGRNIQELNQEWKTSCLTPWGKRFEQEANSKLLSPQPYRETLIDMAWLTRGNSVDQANADKIRIESGVLTVNEVREELGENSIGKEGDLRFISTTLQPLTETLLEIQDLAAKEPPPPPSPAVPAEDPAEADSEEADDDAPEETPVLRQALRQNVLQNLEHLEKKIRLKEADLKKKGAKGDDVAAKIEEERQAFREWMARDCYPALNLIRETAKAQGRHLNGEADTALLAAVDAVLNGKFPAAEADRLMAALLPEVSK